MKRSHYSESESFVYLADDLILGRLLTIDEVARLRVESLDQIRTEVESVLRDTKSMREVLGDQVSKLLQEIRRLPPGLTLPDPGLAYQDDFSLYHTFLTQFIQRDELAELTVSQRRVLAAAVKSEMLMSDPLLEVLAGAARRGLDRGSKD